MTTQIIEALIALISRYAPDLEEIANDLKLAFDLSIRGTDLTSEEEAHINAALKAVGDKIETDSAAQGVTE